MDWPGNVSRPSHMTADRNLKLVVGNGRRNNDSSDADANPYGSSTSTSSNSAWSETPMPTRINPFVSSMLNVRAVPASLENASMFGMSGSGADLAAAKVVAAIHNSATKMSTRIGVRTVM